MTDWNDMTREGGAEAVRTNFDASAAAPRRSRPGPRLRIITAADLDQIEFPDVAYVVPGFISEGLTILAGKPKGGKSWLCLDMALAVAEGGFALGSVKVEEGDALYLSLEDNPRRLQKRMRQLLGDRPKPARLAISTECNPLDKGGLPAIEGWCQDVPNPRLIIIDVFAKVRPDRKEKDGLYEADYKAIAPLKDLADRLGLAVVIVHHTSKRTDAADPFDMISGTTGMTGAADTVIILASSTEGPKLYGRGRDVEEFEKAMRFDQLRGQWTILGDAMDIAKSDERKAVRDLLESAKEPLSPTAIAQALGKPNGAIRMLLGRMAEAGDVVKESRGRYRHPNRWEHADPCDNGDKVTTEG